MSQQKNDSRENDGVRNQRSPLRARRTQRFIELQQMNRSAVCRRRLEMGRNQKLAQVVSNAVQPRFAGRVVAGKRTQEWLVHAQASVSASSSARQHLEAGTSRLVRSMATEFGCP